MINPPRARLFHWGILEMCSITPFWVIPLVWFPVVLYHIYTALKMDEQYNMPVLTLFFIIGLLSWTFCEYCLHRFFFHVDEKLPDNKYALTFHFIFHGIHHAFPMDK
jgi:4-hydroxysphinganine ceramide fatty acyl 2-hydroxylase